MDLLHRGERCRTARGSVAKTVVTGALLACALASGGMRHAAAAATPDEHLSHARRQLYDRIAAATGVPWHAIAAVDRYELTLSTAHPKTRPIGKDAIVGVYIPPERWSGPLNPDKSDKSPTSIRFFSGIGQDGSGDGAADRNDDIDKLYAVVNQIRRHGVAGDDYAIGLWEYYQNTRAVERILQFGKLYATFGKLELNRHAFPLPLGSVYSYRSTWGYSRSWGGYRIHEGTDIFADHGVPVRSTCFGIVEVKGWNRYGGWRIGIRDLDNLYHYYAHLSGFDKNIKPGDVVRPGQVIGWVGSSGYGRPGTQGKFPPHLHYGVYRDRGWVEWAFDPYPMLKRFEREERRALRVHK